MPEAASDPLLHVDEFLDEARNFCGFVDSLDVGFDPQSFFSDAAVRLARLIATAVQLPEVDPDDDDAIANADTGDDRQVLYERLCVLLEPTGAVTYREVFHPWGDEEPTSASLADDLADIYRELRRGLDSIASGGSRVEALWDLRFGFWSHWHEHASGSLRALLAFTARREMD